MKASSLRAARMFPPMIAVVAILTVQSQLALTQPTGQISVPVSIHVSHQSEPSDYKPSEAHVIGGYPSYEEELMLYLVNEKRCDPAYAGWPSYSPVKPLICNYELNYVARAHCIDMHDNGCFQHDSCDGTPWDQRVRAYYDTSLIGENIACGYSTVEQAMDGWMNSTGHRQNILDPYYYRELGCGVYHGTQNYNDYYTQDFGYMANFPIPLVPCGIATPKGSSSQATYTFKAIYYATRHNAGAGAPAKAWVIIDGTCYTMTRASGIGTDGYGVYEYQKSLSSSSHWYFFYFEAPDGRLCTYPPTGTFQINSSDFWSAASADVPCLTSTAYSSYFNSGLDSWSFVTVPGVFAAPTSQASSGMLSLASSNNTSTFGYWQSPSSSLLVEANTLYKARFRASSDARAENSATIPEIRLRANAANLQQADYLTIDSNGDALYSPRNYGMDYDLYFVPADSSVGSHVTFSFDLLNFNPADAAVATVSLDSVVVNRIPLASLGSATNVIAYDFSASQQGWTFGGAPVVFTLPTSNWAGTALQMTATNNTNTFGFWYSPNADVALQRDALYRGRFTVATNTSDASRVPTVRVRFNTENLQASLAKEIVSAGNGASSPTAGGRTYDLYMVPPETAVGSAQGGMSLSFDLLNFDPADDAAASLMLDAASVDTFAVPTIP